MRVLRRTLWLYPSYGLPRLPFRRLTLQTHGPYLQTEMMERSLIPVLMCGGAGTRLWPISRESMPKQFVPLVGEGSTFQQVLRRVADPALFGRPVVITNTDFRFLVAEQLRECGIEADIVLEPAR